MEKSRTISFQTTAETSKALERMASKERQSVSSVIESIVRHYLDDHQEPEGTHQNRRRLERKKVCVPAFIGDPRWQRRDFVKGSILDISFGGIRVSAPKGTNIEIQNDGNPKEIRVIFSLADVSWPVNLKCYLKHVSESEEEVLLGGSLAGLDCYTYTILQKYLI